MSQNLVSFKGKQEGISIYIKDGDFSDIKNEIEQKIKKSEKFFIGAKIIEISGVEGKEIKNTEKKEIEKLLSEKYNMIIDIKKENTPKKQKIESYFEGIYEGNTKFIHSTIRSGQMVKYDGNIVVIGDVNPGGEVIANGNIVVLGSLRGMANAGFNGNKNAIVAAIHLNPTQLRIADVLSRKPDEEVEAPKGAEVASIYKENIIIESYLAKK